MSAPRLILCGGARVAFSKAKRWTEHRPVRLSIGKGPGDVHLKSGDIPNKLVAPLPARASDLLEIAAYVFTADQAVSRGGDSSFEYGQKWRRNLRFKIPVRDTAFWSDRATLELLTSTLGFLSDDDYEFEFEKNSSPAPIESYLPFGKSQGNPIEEVMLFSGGLDSFCGAVQEVVVGQRRVALVSHVPTGKIGKPQRELVAALAAHAKSGSAPLHVPVRLNKGKELGIDNAQRTRSFVFAAMAGAVARGFGLSRFRFYENGPVSFNLPIAAELVGGRASRTTHPLTIKRLRELLTLVYGVPFEIENPFLWRTRTEILEQLKSTALAPHCAKTISCAHTKERTVQHSHCGRCSQCIDRRFAARAAGMRNDDDPVEMYAAGLDMPCRDEVHRTLIERYVGSVLKIRSITTVTGFLAQYGEVGRVLSSLPGPTAAAADLVFQLHRRHADQVHLAVVSIIQSEASRIADHSVPHDSPLGILARVAPPSSGSPSPSSADGAPGATEAPIKPSYHRSPVADDERLVACFRDKECFLGNTMELKLFGRLARRPGTYVTTETLFKDVWGGNTRTKNTVHKTASILRRKLRDAGMADMLTIDGKQRDRLAMHISADGKS